MWESLELIKPIQANSFPQRKTSQPFWSRMSRRGCLCWSGWGLLCCKVRRWEYFIPEGRETKTVDRVKDAYQSTV